ncbi:hypothetical protein AMATHDRAFT_70893 [Amanita thiersii Skay4041]|uniref:Uncharacterized protein n=1 Tax=Amanita thiersii Skay4041 TaxID=703135 RepID=A0A2A9NCE7_9AGAR|nr:hypothetical protein AMATHDRAFT_70893 [Amanita thiersii Skay4041]
MPTLHCDAMRNKRVNDRHLRIIFTWTRPPYPRYMRSSSIQNHKIRPLHHSSISTKKPSYGRIIAQPDLLQLSIPSHEQTFVVTFHTASELGMPVLLGIGNRPYKSI